MLEQEQPVLHTTVIQTNIAMLTNGPSPNQ